MIKMKLQFNYVTFITKVLAPCAYNLLLNFSKKLNEDGAMIDFEILKSVKENTTLKLN